MAGKTQGKDAHLSTYDKLVKLIQESVDGCAEYWASRIADHLMENGVTVKEQQKPLWFCDFNNYLGQVVYVEKRTGEIVPVRICEVFQWGIEVELFGSDEGETFEDIERNATWRAWQDPPTEEERRAAEWES